MLRTITVTATKASKRKDRKELVSSNPNHIDKVLEANGRKTLRMRQSQTGMFLGHSNGLWVTNPHAAKRFNPEEARRFLSKGRKTSWEAN